MLAFLPSFIKGPLGALLVIINTVFWSIPLLLTALLKVLVPIPAWRKLCANAMVVMAESWIRVNNVVTDLTQRIEWDVQLPADLDHSRSYLVISNHQSWADIVVLQRVFNRRIPFLRFFLKQQLIWVPLLGMAWWALDFPFMRRHSREVLAKHPEKRREDLEITRRACEKFREQPVSIMNFVEGTRFTAAKQASQQKSYRHLLKPKAGGVAFALNAMEGSIRTLLDVTIAYQPHRAGFGDLFSGKVKKVMVRVHELPVPERFLHGDYQENAEWRAAFKAWLRERWERKDEELERLLADEKAA